MYAVATFLVVAVLSLAFTQIASGALIATGLPPDVARFQARSAFSGAGFTTTEAENVVNHPVRRRIIGATMFVGNLGTPTLVVTVLIGFLAPGPGSTTARSLVVLSGLLLAVLLITNRPMKRRLVGVGHRYARSRLLPHLEHESHEVFVVDGDFVIGTIRLSDEPGDAALRSLRAIDQALPTVQLLGVRQGDRFEGKRPTDVDLVAGDELIVYGLRDELASLAE